MGNSDGPGGGVAIDVATAIAESALIGRTLGEFVIREPLSGGGFGEVFLAEQKTLGREAVIKVLREHHSSATRRWCSASCARRGWPRLLDHPYAAHIYAFGAEPDGLLWIAMELVRGTPLDTLLRVQGPMPLERFVPLLGRICEVVHTAHEQGIVHRDLKPANVMVLSRAGQLLPKLLDFGIAKLTSDEAEPPSRHGRRHAGRAGRRRSGDRPTHRLTGAGMAMGSPHYMAPEQWNDAGAADARADIYALGVICYEALTGTPPFRAPSREELAALHARGAGAAARPGFPAALDAVLATRDGQAASATASPSALELAAAFRAASGDHRAWPSAAAPRPALRDGRAGPARRSRSPRRSPRSRRRATPHQARDALWQIGPGRGAPGRRRRAGRATATSARSARRRPGARRAAAAACASARRPTRSGSSSRASWCAPFADLRDAHPVPELVAYLLGDGVRPRSTSWLALRASEERSGGGEEQVRDLLERGLPLAARAVAGARVPLRLSRWWSPTDRGDRRRRHCRLPPGGRRRRARRRRAVDGRAGRRAPAPARSPAPS